ncbi:MULTISPECIES: RDD family protein [Lysinibacillus]|uniref:RDD family protein n=1 Tax=Lysinibacillus TaxID=400634 RepID=UPI001CBAF8CC|nr:RDD family protein [Lysinibacillus sphaericus]
MASFIVRVGALVGFFLAPVVWALFPSQAAVEAKAAEMAKKDIVKPLSILLALAIDLFIAHCIWMIIGAVIGYSNALEFLVKIALYLLVFGVVPSFANGATLGMKFVRFTMVSEKGKSII